jgi:cytochrome P450
MASFTLTPVEKGILRCRHSGAFTPEDIQSLAAFLREYVGKLLIDLTGADAAECSRHIHHFRPMMPTAAVFGAPIDPNILVIDKSYYANEVKYFKTEAEALAWLRNQ